MALLIEKLNQEQVVVRLLENEAKEVGLYCKPIRSEIQNFNLLIDLKVNNRQALKIMDDSKYPGTWIKSTKKDFVLRKAFVQKNGP